MPAHLASDEARIIADLVPREHPGWDQELTRHAEVIADGCGPRPSTPAVPPTPFLNLNWGNDPEVGPLAFAAGTDTILRSSTATEARGKTTKIGDHASDLHLNRSGGRI